MIGLKVQSISDFLFRTIFLFFIWALSSCGSTQVISANSSPAVMASEPLSPEEVLDIGIITFDPNIPNDIEESNENLVVPDVRRAESRYIAYHLKNTLENTGNWGAVRVLPNSTESSHIEISGKILSSDGEMLRIKITAIDSKKNKWIERIFEDRATGLGYENPTEDPFQDLYNEIANELLAFKASLSSRDSANIKEIAKLRFARDLAPEKFDGYLVEDQNGSLRIEQLPASNDPMMIRVAQLEELDFLFIDTLDTHFNKFYRETQASYDEWRRTTFSEALRLRELQKEARRRIAAGALMIVGGIAAEGSSSAAAYTGAIGGVTAIRQGLSKRVQATNQELRLRELNEALASEITPYVLDIEGKTIQISGSAEQQFKEWKTLLKRIYADEISFLAN
ncbi:hypothetical protein OA067_02380 [Gammaproteobacteria bacterium]|jgi:SNF2 family DNA or RNA helicase|nr:hypothetical protein [Gammaproteobacteria bacterium]MEC8644662.1 hypothetical protein [Pseudomonadota bacterium]|tara:strand:+ start:181 stop:1368 length:1188 start_codon:yes stop_codon:yes gene_type:complete